MRLITGLLTSVIVVALVWVLLSTLLIWRFQERVVFQPPSASPAAPDPARRVEYTASDGHQLVGYLLSPPRAGGNEPTAVVIAFHGNADLAVWQVPWARELAERAGVTVFAAEYRGYGGLPGVPTYLAAASDARGALDFVRAHLGPSSIVLYGHSLGSAVATELAAQMQPQPPRALVLVSPFTSARAMAVRMLLPPIPGIWSRISRVHYDTRAHVAVLESPVYVAHGHRDLNIPVRMGRQVFAAARRPGQLLVVEGAGHNDVPDVGGERYWSWLVSAVAGGAKP